jgi:hypothetical protein
MFLHVECCTVPRDPFGRLLSPLEAAEGLVWSETLGPGQLSEPLPAGAGLILTLTPTVDLWLAIGTDPDPAKAPRRWMRAGIARTFETSGGLRIAWVSAVPDNPPVLRRKAKPSAAEPAA